MVTVPKTPRGLRASLPLDAPESEEVQGSLFSRMFTGFKKYARPSGQIAEFAGIYGPAPKYTRKVTEKKDRSLDYLAEIHEHNAKQQIQISELDLANMFGYGDYEENIRKIEELKKGFKEVPRTVSPEALELKKLIEINENQLIDKENQLQNGEGLSRRQRNYLEKSAEQTKRALQDARGRLVELSVSTEPSLYKNLKWYHEGLLTLSELKPVYWEALKSGAVGTLPGAASGAVAGSAAGSLLGPGFPTALGFTTIAGAGAGFKAGMMTEIGALEAGNAYGMMTREMGVDPDIARNIAFGVGATNAALEMVSIKLLTGPFSRMKSKLFGQTRKMNKRLLSKESLKKRIAKFVARYGGSVMGETGVEMAQELVTEEAAVFSAWLSKELGRESPITGVKSQEEIKKRVIDTGVKVAKAFVLLNAPGNVGLSYVESAKQEQELRMKEINSAYQAAATIQKLQEAEALEEGEIAELELVETLDILPVPEKPEEVAPYLEIVEEASNKVEEKKVKQALELLPVSQTEEMLMKASKAQEDFESASNTYATMMKSHQKAQEEFSRRTPENEEMLRERLMVATQMFENAKARVLETLVEFEDRGNAVEEFFARSPETEGRLDYRKSFDQILTEAEKKLQEEKSLEKKTSKTVVTEGVMLNSKNLPWKTKASARAARSKWPQEMKDKWELTTIEEGFGFKLKSLPELQQVQEEKTVKQLMEELEKLPVMAYEARDRALERGVDVGDLFDEVERELVLEDVSLKVNQDTMTSEFFQEFDDAVDMAEGFVGREKEIANDPEMIVQYLINNLNLAIHGDTEIDVGLIKRRLNEAAIKVNDKATRDHFNNPFDHQSFVKWVSDAAAWASNAKIQQLSEEELATRAVMKVTRDQTIRAQKELETAEIEDLVKSWEKDGVTFYSLPFANPELLNERAIKAQKWFKTADETKKGLKKDKVKWFKKASAAMVDISGDLKGKFYKNFGLDGALAIEQMVLSYGATAQAKQALSQFYKAVYKGLSREELYYLDQIIFSKRVIQVGKVNEKIRNPQKTIKEDYEAYLEYLKSGLGEKIYSKLEDKSRVYFDSAREVLDLLHEEGLVGDSLHSKLRPLDYQLRRKMRELDPVIGTRKRGSKTVEVTESGVERIAYGEYGDLLEIDSLNLLAEITTRAYGRVARNKAVKSLLPLARSYPDNLLVREKTKKDKIVGKDWLEVNYYDEGKKKKIYLSPLIKDQWVTVHNDASMRLANILRVVGGSALLRPFATGINMAFALTQVPMDILQAYVSTQVYIKEKWEPVYSPVGAPIQMSRDFMPAAIDAAFRKGRFTDAIEDGMGMQFMVNQGQALQRAVGKREPLGPVMDFLSYPGATMELTTRLMVRDSALRKLAKEKGISLAEARADPELRQRASFAARDYLDYSQGGWLAKSGDNLIPYLNASIQGTRGILKAAKNNPKDAVAKAVLLAAPVSLLYLMNMSQAPDGYSTLSDEDKINYWNIMLPDYLAGQDEIGDKVYLSAKIKKPPAVRLMATFWEMCFSKILSMSSSEFNRHEFNLKLGVKALKSLSPVDLHTLSGIPMFEAVIGYAANFDFWKFENIWQGGKRDPYLERTPRTPQYAKDVGEVSNLATFGKAQISPERLDYALKQLFTEGTVYSHGLGMAYNLFRGTPEEPTKASFFVSSSRQPILKKFIRASKDRGKGEIEDMEVKEGTEKALRWEPVNQVFYDMARGNATISDFLQAAKGLKDEGEVKQAIKKLEKTKNMEGLDNKSLMFRLEGKSPEVQGGFLAARYVRLDKGKKMELLKSAILSGIYTKRTQEEFSKALVMLRKNERIGSALGK